MAASEFELIKKYFQNISSEDPCVKYGIGDDAAIIQVPQGMDIVLSMDTLVEGTHFLANASPYDIGYKVLAVNLSDMAAMGALPKWALLSISLPKNDEVWLKEFVSGFSGLAKQHSISLIGGDMSRGALSITLQIQGLVPTNTALKRDGAKKGDLIYATGFLGDAGVGLDIIQDKLSFDSEHEEFFLGSLNRPEISIEAGLRLRNIASSVIDISDGLIADLGHILDSSDVGAEIEVKNIPLSEAMQRCLDEETAWDYALTSGDDYKLCFTAKAAKHDLIINTFEEINIPVSYLGKIREEDGLRLKNHEGACFEPSRNLYHHF